LTTGRSAEQDSSLRWSVPDPAVRGAEGLPIPYLVLGLYYEYSLGDGGLAGTDPKNTTTRLVPGPRHDPCPDCDYHVHCGPAYGGQPWVGMDEQSPTAAAPHREPHRPRHRGRGGRFRVDQNLASGSTV